jgi:hypothetical protein
MFPGLLPIMVALVFTVSDTSRICLAPTSVESSPGDATAAANAVRDVFTGFLTGPSLQPQPLKARLESQVREEARQTNCPYLLLTTLKHEQKHHGGSLLGRVAAGAAQQGAWEAGVSSGTTAGRIAGSAAYGAAGQAAYNYATSIHEKDEVTLGYRLESGDGRVLIEKTEKRKAKSNGEDLLTPLVQQASEAIANAVTHPAR